MRSLKASLVCVLIFCGTCTAYASSECAAIENDIARLDCYDSIYRVADSAVELEDIDTALNEFRGLSEYWGQNGWKQIFFDDCKLYDHTVKGPESPFFSNVGVYQLLLDLRKVDLEKSSEGRSGVRIVMARGGEVYKSTQGFGRAGGNTPLGWSPPLDINPLIWEKLTLQEGEAKSLYSFNQPVQILHFNVYRERSATWNFSLFFPEDNPEIGEAFFRLARICQRSIK